MKKKFYVTTAIAYVNSSPHIGFALEVLEADVMARYHQLRGSETFYLTGTDEHGVKLVETAEKLGKTPKALTDENAKKFEDLTKALNLSNNAFIRTSDQEIHWPGVVKIWKVLDKKGDIYKKKYRGLYCVGHEAFVQESDLVDGVCPDHKTKPEIIEEENYFFKLSKYQKELEKYIETDEIQIIPESRKNEILSFIRGGLEDVSFSRPKDKLSWGVPVPGDETQVIYVWADALTNYISAIGYGRDAKTFKKWWPADVHVIGKDILRFHAAIWPAILMSAEIDLPKRIFVHGFISSAGQKMSKSLGNVIDPFELVKKYGVDAVRYYLLREIPSTGDGDFTYEKFEARYSSDLVNTLGNLVSRLTTLGEGVTLKGEINEPKRFKEGWQQYEEALLNLRLNEGLVIIWDLVRAMNERIDKEKIWELKKTKINKFNEIYGTLIYCLAQIARRLKPYLPETSDEIFKVLGIDGDLKDWKLEDFNIKKGDILFPRIKTPIYK
jgi:methionyl-tRNA synthetase